MQKAPYANCDNCPLKDRVCVPDYVPEKIDLIVVGEAPGYTEAREGIPFVGDSGKLLDRVLIEANINPKNVYKTNAVLCHPDKNQTPDHTALLACSERLRTTLQQLDPSIPIVTLGAIATEAMERFSGQVDRRGITTKRGTSYNWDQHTYTATLHPAFILRSPQYARMLYEDLIKATRKTNTINWLATKYAVMDAVNHDKMLAYLEQIADNSYVAFDVETTGLNPYDTNEKQAKNICLVITDRLDRSLIIPGVMLKFVKIAEAIQKLFNRVKLVAHNGKFDQSMLLMEHYSINAVVAFDTMLASQALSESKGIHRLKQLGTLYLDVPNYEDQLINKHFRSDATSDERDYSTVPINDLYHYAAIDGVVTLALVPVLYEKMVQDNVLGAFDMLMRGSNAIVHTQHNGIKIDTEYLIKVADIVNGKITAITQDLRNIVQDQHYNPNSPDQTTYYIFEDLQLRPTTKISYKTKADSTNAEMLAALPPHPFVLALREYRRVEKIRSTYIAPLFAMLDKEDRVHVDYKMYGAETGRLSAGRSLHGIPRPEGNENVYGDILTDTEKYGAMIRGSFCAKPGYKLVAADYSQAELRVLTAECLDPFLLGVYNITESERHLKALELFGNAYADLPYNDPIAKKYRKIAGDLHDRTALEVFDKYKEWLLTAPDLAKERRVWCKNINFGEVYEGGASGISGMMGGKVTAQQLIPIIQRKKQLTPKLTEWKIQQFKQMRELGYVQTRFGYKRRAHLITNDNHDELKKAAVNAPIQSSASCLTLDSLVYCVNEGIKICHFVHDSLIAEAREDEAKDIGNRIRDIMIDRGNHWFSEVRWDVDVDISDYWYQNRPKLD